LARELNERFPTSGIYTFWINAAKVTHFYCFEDANQKRM